MTLVIAGGGIGGLGLALALERRGIAWVLLERAPAIDPVGVSMGIILALMTRHAPLTRSFVEVVTLIGLAGFGATLGVHVAIGYTDATHLAPAYAGCALFLVGVARLATARGG